MNALAIVIAIIGAAGGLGGLTLVLYIRPTYRKLNAEAKKAGAEASEIVAQGAVTLLQPLHNQIIGLQNQVEALEKTLAQERRTSQEERLVAQQTIDGLRDEIRQKDRRIREFEQHLQTCGSLHNEGR